MLHNHKRFDDFKKIKTEKSQIFKFSNSASPHALNAKKHARGFRIQRRFWEMLILEARRIVNQGVRFMWRVAYKSRRRMRRARQALAERRRQHAERRNKLSPLANPGSMLALEPRIVFDAAAAATVDQTADQVAEQQTADAVENREDSPSDTEDSITGDDLAAINVTETGGSEIAFVDGSLEDIDELLAEIDESVEIVMLDTTLDGIEQIAAALNGRDDIDAIHILSHGNRGQLNLGTGVLNAETMQGEYSDELAVIRDAMSESGDILIYGCDFSGGTIGHQAAELLSELTGADVAASEDDTGHESLGGDWDLETKIGIINVEAIHAVNWEQLMAPINVTVVDGTTTTATTLGNNIAGNGVTVTGVTFTGQNAQGGTFTGATGYPSEWLGYDSGVILSTGNVVDVSGTPAGNSSTNHSGAGDADLESLANNTSFDASVLEVSFVPTGNLVTLQFTFGSEEYNEYVYSNFNDAIGIWVNGSHSSVTPTGDPVAIDGINQAGAFNPGFGIEANDPNPGNGVFDSSNPSLYVNNSTAAFNVEMDGFTVTLTFTANVNVGVTNTIKLGVADIGDGAFDSWLFVRENSLQTNTIANTDLVSTPLNTAVTIDALANDFDAEGDPLTITHVADQPVTPGGAAVTLATGATVQLTLAGQLLFTPATGQTGADTFTYTIADGTGSTAVGFSSVQIGANSPPVIDLNDDGTTAARDFGAAFNEGDFPVLITDPTASIIDTNDNSFPSLDITLGGFLSAGNEIFSIGGTDFTFGTAQTSTVHVAGVSADIAYDGANGISVTNTIPFAEIAEGDLEALIQSITYQHTGDAVQDGNRTFSFQVDDGDITSNI
nr:choice-of-anchor L domain-containing protein [Alphaproteobacteria bacterium]